MEALPVMRHLRPEFRAQLQLYSPKKVPKASPGRLSNGSSNGVASAGSLNGGSTNNHNASNGNLSHHHHSHLSQHLTNGKLTTNGTSSSTTSSLLSSSMFSSSTSVATVVESKTIATKSSSSSTSSYQTTTEASSSLSATATTTKSENAAANACDATGPTTAANQHSEQRESPSTIAVESEAAAVTAQASVEKEATIGVEPSIPVQQQKQQHQQQEVVSSSKMKLSEPCVNGGDGVDNVAIIRNGTSTLIKNGHHCLDHEDKENINGGVAPELAPSAKVVATTTPVKDGNHFLQVMKNEQNRLLAMAADIEREVEQCKTDGVEISEEVAGYVLVAAGKARLLCSQKMKQFEGLCHNNLNQIPGEKFQTTNEDLQGFWDMVMLQVNDVDASFVEIDSFRRNGWKKPTPVSPVPQARSTARSTKLTKRPFKTPASAIATTNGSAADAEAKKAAAAKRIAERKQQLAELKRKQKLASSQLENVEIFVPGSSNGSAEVVSNGVATS